MLPPNTSRGHNPLAGLLLANPAMRFTADSARDALTQFGCPVPNLQSVRSSLGGFCRSGVLSRKGAEFWLAIPAEAFLSLRERERHMDGLRRGAATSRYDEIRVANLKKRSDLAQRIRDHLAAHQGRSWGEVDLMAALGTASMATRTALSDLMGDGTVRYWPDTTGANHNSRHSYQAMPPARPHIVLNGQHERVLSALKTKRSMSTVDVRRTLGLSNEPDEVKISRKIAEGIVLDLHHAGRAVVVMVGAAYILRAAV